MQFGCDSIHSHHDDELGVSSHLSNFLNDCTSARICVKITPLANWTVLDPFSGSKLTSDTPKCSKNAFLTSWDPNALECLCSPHFSDILGFQKSFHLNSIQLTSNFSSDHSDLIFILLNLDFKFLF